MESIWIQIALLAALVVLNGVLAGSEMALVSLRESQARRLGARGRRGRALVRLHDDPNRFLSAIQIGITLAERTRRPMPRAGRPTPPRPPHHPKGYLFATPHRMRNATRELRQGIHRHHPSP